jgi:uncharacterized membrane protein YkvI
VPRCLFAVALVLVAVGADTQGAHAFAFYVVLAAIPATAVAALSCFGDLVEGSADGEAGALYVGLTGLALALLVIGSAARSSTLGHASVPALGVSAVVAALALLVLHVAIWTALRVSRERVVTSLRSPASDV